MTCRRPTIFARLPHVLTRTLHVEAASHLLSLARPCPITRIILVAAMTTTVHTREAQPVRRTKEINGKRYAIEALQIDRQRWRARIAAQGATNALMPFYGSTAEEAIDQLIAWLSRVGRPLGAAASPR